LLSQLLQYAIVSSRRDDACGPKYKQINSFGYACCLCAQLRKSYANELICLYLGAVLQDQPYAWSGSCRCLSGHWQRSVMSRGGYACRLCTEQLRKAWQAFRKCNSKKGHTPKQSSLFLASWSWCVPCYRLHHSQMRPFWRCTALWGKWHSP
jgi:hypothetical protein